MKILKLRFKNLNSLAGEWEVDFTHPDYTETGIFAITGPTGAGKTTILDAITLALYGKTPRLDKISKAENEIITRQTGECFAEVEFETNKGAFRSHWSQRRSRGKADGALQQSQHEIADLTTGKILENKIKNVLGKVEEVTGLDFGRFTRSILLAQGSFAAFLKANSNERSDILEQITGTDIYSEISIKVHERNSLEKKKLDELEAFLGGLQLLDQEELDSLNNQLDSNNSEIKEKSEKKEKTDTALGWLQAIAKIEGQLEDLKESKVKLQEEKEKAAPELEKLTLGKKAQRLEAEYTNLNNKRELETKQKERLGEIAGELPEKKEQLVKLKEDLEKLTTIIEGKREGLEKERKIWVKVRELDTHIKKQHDNLKELEEEEKSLCDNKKKIDKALQQLSEQISEEEKVSKELGIYISEHKQDEKIAAALSGLKQAINAYQKTQSELNGKENDLSRTKESLLKAEKKEKEKEETVSREKVKTEKAETAQKECLESLEKHLGGEELSTWRDKRESLSERSIKLEQLETLVHSINEDTDELSRIEKLLKENTPLIASNTKTVKEYIKQEEQKTETIKLLEENLLLANKVKGLEEQRQQLIDNEPCPLCGSKEHPYAQGNIPLDDPIRKKLSEEKKQLRELTEKRQDIEKKIGRLEHDQEINETTKEKLSTSIANDESDYTEHCKALSLSHTQPERLSMVKSATVECNRQLVSLKNKITEGEKLQKALNEANSSLQQCKDNLTSANDELKDAKHQLETVRNNQKSLTETIDSLRQELDSDIKLITEQVAPFAITIDAETDLGEVLSTLEKRSSAYTETSAKLIAKEKEITDLSGKQEKEKTRLEGIVNRLKVLSEKKSAETARLEEMQSGRNDLYGTKDPDAEEKRLVTELKSEETNKLKLTDEFNALDKDVNTLTSTRNELKDSLKELKSQIQELSTTFTKQLIAQGFSEESAFISARLTSEELDALTALEDALQKKEQELNTQWNDRQKSLTEEKGRKLTEESEDQLKETAKALSQQLTELQKATGAIQGQLEQQKELQKKQADQLQEIEKQQKECARWNKLHALIGSADGKKFRNFAQGLTFDLMISHANNQLQKMTDRYILLRDETDPLELNVIDNYQAGIVRSTKNLSGGEGFIASLALALGLSQMASQKVRVDSLFLDEGFGTLDEETLGTALDTLAGLHQDGKLIGVISHIQAMKDRIPTQIKVEPVRNGQSRLAGAGIN